MNDYYQRSISGIDWRRTKASETTAKLKIAPLPELGQTRSNQPG